jgi:acyl-CoA synthetase (AMP-forming)/AMP-acid ligase II
MLEKSLNAAQNLVKIGVRPGDIVTICASNTDDVFATIIGAVMAEAVLNTLDVNFKDCETFTCSASDLTMKFRFGSRRTHSHVTHCGAPVYHLQQ